MVTIHLLVNGSTIRVAQMGPDFLLVDHPVDHGPTEATLVQKIDNSESKWKVRLPDGISSKSERVALAPA